MITARIILLKFLFSLAGHPQANSTVELLEEFYAVPGNERVPVESLSLCALRIDGVDRIGVHVKRFTVCTGGEVEVADHRLGQRRFIPVGSKSDNELYCRLRGVEVERENVLASSSTSSETAIVPFVPRTKLASKLDALIRSIRELLRVFSSPNWEHEVKEAAFTNPLKSLSACVTESSAVGDKDVHDAAE